MKLDLTLKNKEYVSRLFRSVADQALADGHQFQFNWSESMIQQALDQYLFFADRSDSAMSAFICFQSIDQDFEILALGCDPLFRGQNRMKELLTAFLTSARAAGAAVFLEVHERNQVAVNLYKTVGFRQIHIRRAYYKDGANALVLKYSADETTLESI